MTTHDPAFIEAASKLWKDGLSAAKIAKLLGGSRNVFVGLAYRHRALFPAREPRKSAQAKAVPAKRAKKAAPEIHPSAVVHPTAYDAKRLPVAKRLHERSAGECCWPLNNGGPYLFCAAGTTGKYCHHHQARASQKG